MEKEIAKISEDYSPLENEEYMCDRQREYFRRKLLTWRKALEEQDAYLTERLKEEIWNEPDLNDRALVETKVDLELHTKERVRRLIVKINSALSRIYDGSYGYCEYTGNKIGLRRLEARPVAVLCVEAQEKHERFEKNHVRQ